MNTIHDHFLSLDITSQPFSRIEEMINAMAIFKELGAVIKIEDTGNAKVTIAQTRDVHTGGFQSTAVNGMVLLGLLDAAMCCAALSHLESAHCATVEMSVKFMKPVLGNDVTSVGTVISKSKDLFYCQASISDNLGHIKTLATGIVKSVAPSSHLNAKRI
jgi:uncharacterized protein (TIGR00369 family)